jgi:hypothetical protein
VTTLDFPYKPRPLPMLFAALFFAGCGWVLAHAAQSPHGGLVLLHLVHLGVDGASRFYWILVGACAVFVAFGGLGIWTGLRSRNRLVLTDTTLSVPTWAFSRRRKDVPLAAITRLEDREISGQRLLVVHHAGGKVTISRQLLPDAEAYEDVLAVLQAVVDGPPDDDPHVPSAPSRRP